MWEDIWAFCGRAFETCYCFGEIICELGERMCEFSVEESLNETRHGLFGKICELSVEEPLKECMVCVGRYVNLILWKSH